jgi:phenylacetic acid degradation protein
MAVYEFEGNRPAVHREAYVHPGAVLIGDVAVGSKCFIGAGAVLRADFGKIRVGDGSNVQENCVIHVSPGLEVLIEDGVVIAHGAVLHDTWIKTGGVVGMNAVVLHGAVVEEKGMVAAGSVVQGGLVVPAGKIVAGNPARVKKDIPEHYEAFREQGIALYQELPERYRRGLRKLDD